MTAKKKRADLRKRMLYLELGDFPATPRGALVEYLKRSNLPATQKVWEATQAFWLPLAMRDVLDAQGEELERASWDAVFALLRQVDYLCAALHLDRRQLGAWYYVEEAPRMRLKPSEIAAPSQQQSDGEFGGDRSSDGSGNGKSLLSDLTSACTDLAAQFTDTGFD